MSSTINALSTGSGGLVSTGDASGSLALQTNGTTALLVDTSQNVGLGVTPSAWNSGNSAIQLNAVAALNGTSNSTQIGNNWYQSTSGSRYISTATATLYQQYSGSHIWSNAPSGTAGNVISFTQAMTLDASGNLLVGNTTVLGGSVPGVNINGNGAGLTIGQSGTNKGYYFYNTASTRMQIESVSGTTIACVSGGTNGVSLANGGTSWGSLSDEKLKTAITPFEDATQKINSLRAGTGRYLTDEESVSRSFLIAQDVQKVLPEAVTEDANGNLVLQYTDMIPLLTAAIKELNAKVDAQAAEIAALKGNV